MMNVEVERNVQYSTINAQCSSKEGRKEGMVVAVIPHLKGRLKTILPLAGIYCITLRRLC
jgi:hypothetical protein